MNEALRCAHDTSGRTTVQWWVVARCVLRYTALSSDRKLRALCNLCREKQSLTTNRTEKSSGASNSTYIPLACQWFHLERAESHRRAPGDISISRCKRAPRTSARARNDDSEQARVDSNRITRSHQVQVPAQRHTLRSFSSSRLASASCFQHPPARLNWSP